jgi:hypothetical protein
MYEAISVGPMGKQCQNIRTVLSDPEIMRYVVVTLAEELPVAETLELAAAIQGETGISPKVYCNKTWPIETTAVVAQQPEPQVRAAKGFLEFLVSKLETQRVNLARLEEFYSNPLLLPHCLESEPSRLLGELANEIEAGL